MRAGSVIDPAGVRPAPPFCCRACIDRGTATRSGRRISPKSLDSRGITLTVAVTRTSCLGGRAPASPEDFDDGADAARRHSSCRHVVPDARTGDAQGRGHHRHPPGRGQPGGPRHRIADGAAVRRRVTRTDVRPKGTVEIGGGADARSGSCDAARGAFRAERADGGRRRRCSDAARAIDVAARVFGGWRAAAAVADRVARALAPADRRRRARRSR